MNEVVTDNRVWIGFDLGGTKMNAMLFDSAFTVKGRRRKKSRGSEGVERYNKLVEEALASARPRLTVVE